MKFAVEAVFFQNLAYSLIFFLNLLLFSWKKRKFDVSLGKKLRID